MGKQQRYITLLFILFLGLFSLRVNAEEINYQIIATLDDKEISKGDQANFSINILGFGKCEEAWVHIIPEGMINFSTYSLEFTSGLDPTNLRYLPMTNFSIRGSSQESCIPDTTKTIHPHLIDVVNGESNYLITKGTIITLDNTEGGDYDLNVLFLCKSGKSWHTFSGTNTFHIRYTLENYQHIISLLVFLFGGIITSISAILIERLVKKKRIKMPPPTPTKKELPKED